MRLYTSKKNWNIGLIIGLSLVNTHWGLILCTLYLLRTLFVRLSRIARMSSPSLFSFHCFPLKDCGWNAVPASVSSSVHCSPRTLTLLSPGIHILPLLELTAVPPNPVLCPLDIVSSLQTLISCDTMHHGPSLCMDCVPPAQSVFWPTGFSDTFVECFTPGEAVRTSQALSQSKNPNI